MRTELLAVITKELRQTVRDRRMLVMLLLAPVLQLTLLGFAVNLEVDHLPAALVDLDETPTSRAFLQAMVADPTFDVAITTDDPDTPILSGEARVVIVLPRRFEARLKTGRSNEVQVLVDGSNPIEAQAALDATRRFLEQRSVQQMASLAQEMAFRSGRALKRPSVEIKVRTLYNPSLKSAVYMVPGVAAVVLLIVTTVVSAMGIARERELGTIEQLLVTPLRPTVLLLGKMLPFAGIGLITAGMVLGVGTTIFRVPVRGPLSVVFVATVLYLMSTLGVGVFISTVARTQQQAILGGFFFLLPAILLSGFMSPIENMPDWIRVLAAINPVRYYVEILRSSLLKGAGFAELLRPLFALLIFGAGILGLGSLRFQKRIS
ncbi:MAG: ABC transporter permease [Deltaproteobacteria bacterium]|nr:ABC transporter permease [Deltaproteobacteria bacterium]